MSQYMWHVKEPSLINTILEREAQFAAALHRQWRHLLLTKDSRKGRYLQTKRKNTFNYILS